MITVKKSYMGTELTIQVEGKDMKEELMKASIFTHKDKCFLCGCEELELDANKTGEGHIYIKRKCTNQDCKAASNLGTYKDGSGHFWHKFEIWSPTGGLSDASAQKSTPSTTSQSGGYDRAAKDFAKNAPNGIEYKTDDLPF